MKDRIAKNNLFVQIGILITTTISVIVLIVALVVAINALKESSRMNKITYTAQLYANEQKWIERTASIPHGFVLFAVSSEKANAKAYIRQLLSLVPNNKRKEFSTVADFYNHIWSADKFNTKGKTELRQLYDLSESILYHVHTAFEYKEAGLISKEEYESWAAIIDDLGPHPLLMAAIYNGHKKKYISKNFAKDLKNRMLSSPYKVVVEQFYPAMIDDPKWVDSLYDY